MVLFVALTAPAGIGIVLSGFLNAAAAGILIYIYGPC
ncbi:unnamed protein product [Brassica oleracea]